MMPPSDWVRPSICVVQISSSSRLPPMEVSANIISENTRIKNIEFYDIYQGEQFGMIYPGKYWKDFRPKTGIYVPTWDRYKIEITVKINGKQQTITVGDMVGATH